MKAIRLIYNFELVLKPAKFGLYLTRSPITLSLLNKMGAPSQHCSQIISEGSTRRRRLENNYSLYENMYIMGCKNSTH